MSESWWRAPHEALIRDLTEAYGTGTWSAASPAEGVWSVRADLTYFARQKDGEGIVRYRPQGERASGSLEYVAASNIPDGLRWVFDARYGTPASNAVLRPVEVPRLRFGVSKSTTPRVRLYPAILVVLWRALMEASLISDAMDPRTALAHLRWSLTLDPVSAPRLQTLLQLMGRSATVPALRATLGAYGALGALRP